jgi:hypothetical protein
MGRRGPAPDVAARRRRTWPPPGSPQEARAKVKREKLPGPFPSERMLAHGPNRRNQPAQQARRWPHFRRGDGCSSRSLRFASAYSASLRYLSLCPFSVNPPAKPHPDSPDYPSSPQSPASTPHTPCTSTQSYGAPPPISASLDYSPQICHPQTIPRHPDRM